jgi:hypothetical protein
VDASVDAPAEAEASVCGACPSGACLPDGGCVDCNVDRDCKGSLAHCSPAHVCVQCLPGPGDDCADGSYCHVERPERRDGGENRDGGDAETFSCRPGCKVNANCAPGICTPAHTCTECDPSGADTCAAGKYCGPDGACLGGCKADGAGCASGVCTPAHECVSCISDSECQAPRTCATGTCMAACTQDADCVGAGTAKCCGTRCAFVSRDYKACLACGTTCAAAQFCGATGCLDGAIAQVCDSATATFLLDGLEVDDELAPVVSAGLVAGCPTAITARTLPQTTAGTINGITGQPVVGGGDMQVVLGGPYGQSLIRYLDAQGVTAVFNSSNSQRARFQLRDGNGGPGPFVVDEPQSAITPAHDYFLIETVVDPVSGTLMFAIHGFLAQGTLAGTWHFLNIMLPARGTFAKSYYVYEWTNADGDPSASAGDTYALAASGP